MPTKEDKKFLEQYQLYQQQLQTILIQKENLKLQALEMEKALEELDAQKSKEAYEIVGPIMVKKGIDELKTELNEKKGNLDLRTKTLEKAEERLVKKLKDMQPKLNEMLRK